MTTRSLLNAAVLTGAVLMLGGSAAAEPVGFVAAFAGSVEIRSGLATSWEAAAVDRDVSIGDVIRTGPSSAIKILLADETILSLGEDTELAIDTFVVGAAATQEPSVLRLLRGKARVLVGEAFGGPTRLETHTPTAVIGVKGTEYETYVIEDTKRGIWTLVCNLHGDIFVRHLKEGLKGTVRPTVERCTEVLRDRAPQDEIARPDGFPHVQSPSSQPGQGGTEAALFGAPGVAADGGSQGSLNTYIVEAETLTPGAGGMEPGNSGLGDPIFEDVVQTLSVSGKLNGGPTLLPLPGGGGELPGLPGRGGELP